MGRDPVTKAELPIDERKNFLWQTTRRNPTQGKDAYSDEKKILHHWSHSWLSSVTSGSTFVSLATCFWSRQRPVQRKVKTLRRRQSAHLSVNVTTHRENCFVTTFSIQGKLSNFVIDIVLFLVKKTFSRADQMTGSCKELSKGDRFYRLNSNQVKRIVSQ